MQTHVWSQRARWSAGQPISHMMSLALANPKLVSLAAGFVDQATLPAETTSQVFNRLFADASLAQAALQYGATMGYPPLREALLDRQFAVDRGVRSRGSASLQNVLITAGSNQALFLVSEALLDPGDIVLCAAPTYFVYLGIVAHQGARSFGVAADADGLIPDALDEALCQIESRGELSRVKLVYCTSYFENPSGATVSAERRPQLLEVVRRWSRRQKIYLIEDAAYRELRYEGVDAPSIWSYDDAGDQVIYAGTFSKSFSPGMRVGWALLPRELVEPIHDLKGNHDFGSANLNQHLMSDVLVSDAYAEHIQTLRDHYRVKLAAMLAALDQHLGDVPGVVWRHPQGGLYVWLTLPPEISAGESGRLLKKSLDAGVLYVPGEYCFPTEGEVMRRNTIRLSFGVQSPNRIREGIAMLAQAVRSVLLGAG